MVVPLKRKNIEMGTFTKTTYQDNNTNLSMTVWKLETAVLDPTWTDAEPICQKPVLELTE